jgi:multidrug efflux system membrane fusion protein
LPARRYLAGGTALALVLGAFWFYTHDSDNQPRRRNLAAPVRVAVAEQRDMSVIEHTIGTVLPNSSVAVTARVTGQLVSAPFREGQLVKTGDVLFRIDPRPYQALLNQALAQMARDQAALGNAQADATRYSALYGQNAISTQQRDQAVATAKADAALVESDKAAVDMARLNLEYTTIRSPINGKTGPILMQPGNMITTGATATPLITINEIQPVKVSLALPQSDLPRIQATARTKGLVIQVDQHDPGGETLSAPVNFISNAVANNSGTIELRATFANTDSALVPGQLVDVTVSLANIPNAIVVPHNAVNTGADGQYVYDVIEGRAQQRPVKVLFDDGTNTAIEGQVKKGDMLVVEGQLRVTPGAKVSLIGAVKHPGAKRPRGGKSGG